MNEKFKLARAKEKGFSGKMSPTTPAKDKGAKPCRIDEFGGCSAHPDCPTAAHQEKP